MDMERRQSPSQDFEAVDIQSDERWAEMRAMITAQRLVLEQLCVETFIQDRPENLVKFMERLVEATWSTAMTAESVDSDDAMKRQARVAAQLVRFSASVRTQVQRELKSRVRT